MRSRLGSLDESVLCLAVRVVATLYVKSWCRWLRQRGVCGRVECLLDSSRCRGVNHKRRVTNPTSIAINTLSLDSPCFHSNRRRERENRNSV